jgi:DNA-binding response OmpR family regulator
MPVLFTSGYSMDVVGSGGQDGAVQLLHKPYRRAELAAKVRQMLARPSGA